MMKSLSEFVCQNCGAKSAAFLGRCPQCGAWGSYVETVSNGEIGKKEKTPLVRLDELPPKTIKRIATGISEVDRVLGGGLVPASVVLVAGEPGIGKSTLLTQLAVKISQDKKVIYVSGEESAEQVKLRTERIFEKNTNSIWLAAETDLEKIVSTAISERPDIVIVDSIQTTAWSLLTGTPGSVGQVRESARILTQTAKKEGFTLILVGHVTKEGTIAGPKILEHVVDVVLQFEGDTAHNFRILRATKNRFGQILEVGVFEMGDRGLREVDNPSKFFLKKHSENSTGSAILATISGARSMLVEIQALVNQSNFAQPARIVNGLDTRRVIQLLAVLAKIFRIPVGKFDIFVNVAGGLQVTEPAADLPTALSILSVFWKKPLKNIASAGEVGLLGELREVSQVERRKAEAAKFGFSQFLGPDVETLAKAAKLGFSS